MSGAPAFSYSRSAQPLSWLLRRKKLLLNTLAAKQAALLRLAKQAIEVGVLRLNRLKEARGLRDPSMLVLDRQQKVDQIEGRLLQLLRWTVETSPESHESPVRFAAGL